MPDSLELPAAPKARMEPSPVEVKEPGGDRRVAWTGKFPAKEMGVEGELGTLIAVSVP